MQKDKKNFKLDNMSFVCLEKLFPQDMYVFGISCVETHMNRVLNFKTHIYGAVPQTKTNINFLTYKKVDINPAYSSRC